MTVLTLCGMAQAPAFPGAEGVARWTTTGGRGGKVIHVTNLNDAGEGSLRAAVKASGPRIVVFDVSGIIELQSALKIEKGDITILGQTAPGDGICLKNHTFQIAASNVIVRFIRSRMGDAVTTKGDDAMNAYFKTGSEESNIIIDHCTMSWSTDECGSFYGIRNFTLQWCLLSESLANSIHEKGSHGYGGIWGGSNAAYHHNLLASHTSRNPRFDHDYVNTLKGPLDYVNNVVYNWGGNSSYGGESCNETGTFRMINMINNYYKPGATSSHKARIVNPTTKCTNCTKESTGKVNIVPGHFYITGNYMDGSATVTADNWKGVEPDENTEAMKAAIKSDSRFVPEGYEDQTLLTMHTAENAYAKVLQYTGASLRRDVIDQRIAKETRDKTYTYTGSNGSTGGFIDTPGDVGGWPTYETYGLLADSDNDGMPDAWETANGLNPGDATDAAAYTLDSKGYYTNIEVYANALVEDLVKAQNADALETLDEYYPATKRAEGIAYYDGSTAKGGYPEKPDTPQPGEDGETYTVTFNGSNAQSADGYFTFNPDKHNFNAKFTGTYNGTDYTQGLKMEGATLIQFTTTATSTVTIVQSTWSEHSLKFDDTVLAVASATTPEGSTGVRVYTVNGVTAGLHKITRGSGESGVFAVIVRYGESTVASYVITYKDQNGNILGTKKVYEGDAIGATPYTKNDLTIPDGAVFWGWAYDTSNAWVKASDKVTADVTVIARLLDTNVNIRPDANSGYYEITAGNTAMLLAALKAAGSQEDARIFLPDGTYDLGEIVLTTVTGKNVSIIGQSASKTVIVSAPPVEIEGLGKADLLVNSGEGLYLQDLTLKNDLDYYGAGSAGRAPTLHDMGTKTVCKNVRQLSYQDTYYSHKTGGLFYFEGGEIHGTVDYLCGNGKVYFNGVTLVNEKRSSATISANSELYVFNNCTVENNADEYNLGRAWNDNPVCVYLNTTLLDPGKLIASRWNLNGINCDYSIAGEYATKDAEGNDITPASNNVTFTKASTTMNTILTASALDTYAIDKVLGQWAATAQAEAAQVAAPADAKYANGTVAWTAVSGATAYAIFKNGEFAGITTGTSFDISIAADSDGLTIRAANSRGGFGEPVSVSGTATAISTVETAKPAKAEHAYNLQGIRVGSNAKGLLIIDGKKVIR